MVFFDLTIFGFGIKLERTFRGGPCALWVCWRQWHHGAWWWMNQRVCDFWF
jgi:hypothetical protein